MPLTAERFFVVNFSGRVYALTCAHIVRDFESGKLFITEEKMGRKGGKPATIKGLCYPLSPRDAAFGTDLVDMCVIEFTENIYANFFKGSAYVIDKNTVATSAIGHRLRVAGALKDKSSIIPPDINVGYCNLEFGDMGVTTSDPTLREATAVSLNPQFDNVIGISGSPVFDETANALCGMVARGGMVKNKCNIFYIDIYDIVHFLTRVHKRESTTSYTKNITLPVA
jgi:hypothetical protein